jgi:SAM-dependent methyltransferase
MIQRKDCPCCAAENAGISLVDLPYTSTILPDWFRENSIKSLLQEHNYKVWKCKSCGCLYQQACLDDAEAKRLYTQYSSIYVEPYELKKYAHLCEEVILLKKLCPSVTPKVLDFGVGDASWSLMAKAWGCDLTACDIDEASIRLCEKSGISCLSLEELQPDFYDYINLSEVVEHLSNPYQIIQALSVCLKKNGILKVNCPGDACAEAKLKQLLSRSWSLEEFRRHYDSIFPLFHVNLFNKEALHHLGRRAGLAPFRVPLRTSYQAMILFDSLRQWNRNMYQPFKRWRSTGTWQYFRK